ncbi:MAG: efflux RND transporter permease subunit [Pseudomonadota bacterium]|nr:efflux RND transporter permease subunit [Pseudomonadota bacterium]
MKLFEVLVHKPIATSLMTFALVVLGLIALTQLPVSPLPQAEFPTLRINANLSGASPEVMATTVATPLENELSAIAGIQEISSSSSAGRTSITLQFNLDKSIDSAIQEVQAALNNAQRRLPQSMTEPPRWRKINPADSPILVLTVYSPAMSLRDLSDLAENVIARQISQIDGVSDINISGQRRPALRISADPMRLAAYGLTLADIRQVVNATSNSQPKGSLFGTSQTSTIEANDQLFDAAQYADIVLTYQNQTAVRLKDVATISNDVESPYVFALQNGREGLNLIIYRQPDANIVETVDRIRAALPEVQQILPASVEISVLNDRTRTIRATLGEVKGTLMLTVVLVVIVIALFLRQLSATLIVSSVLVVSLIATFAGMWLLGFSLNNLSLMALIIAVGFVVDDAIVVVENIHQHMERGAPPMQAAVDGVREIAPTVISISIALVAAFIPLLFMDGIVGRLFREFALTVTMAILISVTVGLTLVPMLAARFSKHTSSKDEGVSGWLLRGYGHVLRPVLAHPKLTFGFFVLTVALTVWAYVSIPKGFLPQQDTGFVFGSTQAAQDISFVDMVEKHRQLAEIIGQEDAVQAYGTAIGGSGQSFSSGRFFINLKPPSERDVSAQEWIAQMRPKLAAVSDINMSLRAAQDINLGVGGGRSNYQYLLQGSDQAQLTEWAQRMTTAMSALPELTDVSNEQQLGAAVTRLEIDRTQASRYGLSANDINQALYDAFGQRRISEYQTSINQYGIILQLDPAYQGRASSFNMIQLRSPLTQGMIPLTSVARVLPPETGAVTITRQGLMPSVMISFNLAPDVALGDAVLAIERLADTEGLPDGMTGVFSGSAQAFQDSLASQPLLIGAAILAVYIILGILYESLRHPLVILSTLPSAGLGALLALWLFGQDLSIIALIGLILLIGIVKKNGILMVDFAISARRDRGLSPYDAVYEACLSRFRPIVMTTVTTMLAAVPLIFALGEGAELRQPLGIAIVGGLVISQLLTLFSTPVIYLLLERWLGQPTPPAVASIESVVPASQS